MRKVKKKKTFTLQQWALGGLLTLASRTTAQAGLTQLRADNTRVPLRVNCVIVCTAAAAATKQRVGQ